MSPEPAKGRAADKRSDIWAFGCVVFEMLTGDALFTGETVTEVLASVTKDPPALDKLPADTPAAGRQPLVRGLARDPNRRLRDIGEARINIAGAAVDHTPKTGFAAERAPRAPISSQTWL